MKFFSIAIDGPSGAGKSSLAKKIAKEFGFIYVDTGAIYRTLGLACSRAGISCKDEKAVASLLPKCKIEISYDLNGTQKMLLNGEDVSEQIRMPEISICASDVSSLPVSRAFLLNMQRSMAESNSVVMDGRDIGTVVLPNADLKLFLTASAEKRAERRLLELRQKGVSTTFEEVLKDIRYRDDQDTHRAIAPLKKAENAILIDTSNLDFEQSFKLLCKTIRDHYKG